MKKYFLITAVSGFILVFISLCSFGQVSKPLDKIIPSDIIDARTTMRKSIGGIGATVSITMDVGVKYLDGCSDGNYGNLNVEIVWYNQQDETGKMLIGMMKQLNTVEQDKATFLKGIELGNKEEFSKGTLLLASSHQECINEITGGTGKIEYSSEVKYFSFSNNAMLKITLSSKIKPETAKGIISKVQDEVSKFDFSMFINTVVVE